MLVVDLTQFFFLTKAITYATYSTFSNYFVNKRLKYIYFTYTSKKNKDSINIKYGNNKNHIIHAIHSKTFCL